MDDRVTMTIEHGVADVRLARADKLNALDAGMLAALIATIDRIAGLADVRCVVLSGEGRAFSVGIDLAALGEGLAGGELGERRHGIANGLQQVAWGWRSLPQPVIAAVHGFAFGAGLQIMLGADIRLCAPDAELSVMEMRWGLVPDMAGIALLRGLVRDDVARELAYTARRVDGHEAATLGLVTRVSDHPRGDALALASAIARGSPGAVRAAKRLFNAAADADAGTILAAESAEQAALIAGDGYRESRLAAQEKRAPLYRD